AKPTPTAADPPAKPPRSRDSEAAPLIRADLYAALTSLRKALRDAKANGRAIKNRRKVVAVAREDLEAKRRKLLDTARNATPIHSAWLAACINEVKSEDTIVVSELGVPVGQLDLPRHGTFLGNMLAGALGSGLGAALS